MSAKALLSKSFCPCGGDELDTWTRERLTARSCIAGPVCNGSPVPVRVPAQRRTQESNAL